MKKILDLFLTLLFKGIAILIMTLTINLYLYGAMSVLLGSLVEGVQKIFFNAAKRCSDEPRKNILENLTENFYATLTSSLNEIGEKFKGCAKMLSKFDRQIMQLEPAKAEIDTQDGYIDTAEGREKYHREAMLVRARYFRELMEKMEDYELLHFDDICMVELTWGKGVLNSIRQLLKIVESEDVFNEYDIEFEMRSATSKSFTFLFSKFRNQSSFMTVEDTYDYDMWYTCETIYSDYDSELIEAYGYEVKRRFAESLEKELEKHDKPATRRVKI